jgi:hypothetical protein
LEFSPQVVEEIQQLRYGDAAKDKSAEGAQNSIATDAACEPSKLCAACLTDKSLASTHCGVSR